MQLSTQHRRFRFIVNRSGEAHGDEITRVIQIRWGSLLLIDSVGRYSWVYHLHSLLSSLFHKDSWRQPKQRGNTATPLLSNQKNAENSSISELRTVYLVILWRLIPDLFGSKSRLEKKYGNSRSDICFSSCQVFHQTICRKNCCPLWTLSNHIGEWKEQVHSPTTAISIKRRRNNRIARQSIPVKHSNRNNKGTKAIRKTTIYIQYLVKDDSPFTDY